MNLTREKILKHTKLTAFFALCITATAMSMSAASAMDRGGTAVDQALILALSVAICAGTHLIPALSRKPVAWLLWFCCLLSTVFGHITFFTHANLRAGEVRAQQSVLTIDVERQVRVANEALAAIKARPVSIVAADLAISQDWKRRTALKVELTEAKRAAALRDNLVRLSAIAATSKAIGGNDPVTSIIANATGSNTAIISLVINLIFSILLELLGAFLWWDTLRQTGVEHTASVPSESQTAHDQITWIRNAVTTGECRSTVTGIREFLGCSQAKALEIRRALK